MARNTINNGVTMTGGAEGAPRARRYRVVIAYDGTAYSGWQYQENAVGIQQVVEDVLASLDGAPVRVFGSSRTDAGVHAKGFVGHFHLAKPIPAKNLVRAMNARLPDAIRILKASYAKEDFDARLSAKGKEYRYQLYQADIMPPHLAPYWTFCHRPLDLARRRISWGSTTSHRSLRIPTASSTRLCAAYSRSRSRSQGRATPLSCAATAFSTSR